LSTTSETTRREISPSNLHISSFVIVKKKGKTEREYSILLLRAGEKHPLSFRRGKLVLPSTILDYGEKPREAAKRALGFGVSNFESLQELQFVNMQTYYGAHWDIVFLFETWVNDEKVNVVAKDPFTSASFYLATKLPRQEISADHLDVLDEMLRPSDVTTG
jgi:hypothetical protein